jgi:hypothetical protein
LKKEERIRKLAEEAIELRNKGYGMKAAVYAVLDNHNVHDWPTRKQLDSDISRYLAERRKAQLEAERRRKEFALLQPALPFQ